MKVKKMKNSLCLLMVFIITFSSIFVIYATQQDVFRDELVYTITEYENYAAITFEFDDAMLTVRVAEREYGVVFYEYLNGELIRMAVVYHGDNRAHIYSLDNRLRTIEIIEFSDFICTEEIMLPSSHNYSMQDEEFESYAIPFNSPFPGMSSWGVVQYNAFFNPNESNNNRYPHLPTHQVSLFYDGGRNFIPGQALQFHNVWLDPLTVSTLVVSVLGVAVGGVAFQIAGEILNILGIRGNALFFVSEMARFGSIRTMHTFGVVGSVRHDITSPPGGARQFQTVSYFLTSTTHFTNVGIHWQDLGISTATLMPPMGNATFGRRIFTATFGSVPALFSIVRW
jgi:hypothetical protein